MSMAAFRRVRSILRFEVPIRQKFWLFGVSTGVWVVLITVVAVLGADSPIFRVLELGAASVMLVALVGFSVLISRSLTGPVAALGRRIRELADGEALPTGPDLVGRRDELDALQTQSNRLLDALQEVRTFKKVIEEDTSSEDVYARLVHEFGKLGLTSCAIHQVTANGSRMQTALSCGAAAEGACSLDIFVDASLCRAKKTGALVASHDYPEVCRQYVRRGPGQGHVCVPVTIGGAPGAVIQFVFDGADDPEAQVVAVARARRFIDEARPVLETRRLMDALRETSVRDPLTGLHNRRFLEEALERLVAGARRRQATLGLLMCDLDFFKEVNDTHGHDVGDAVLRETSRRIGAAVRANDIVIRFGGEEFLVVLEDAAAESPMEVAERIRKTLDEAPVQAPVGTLHKTISIGVAEFPTDGTTFWQAVKFADVAMYQAKQTGRNRVVRFTPEMWTSKEY